MGTRATFTAIALCAAVALLAWAWWPAVGALVNAPGLLLVLGGTLLASVIGRSAPVVTESLATAGRSLREKPDSGPDRFEQLLEVADRYRRGDLRTTERLLAALDDDFLQAGLRLAIGRESRADIVTALQSRIDQRAAHLGEQVEVLRMMAGYAPAFGMLGTLLGLLGMLPLVDADNVSALGQAAAFAMLTTVYGLVAAYVVLKPLAAKVEQKAQREIQGLVRLAQAILLVQERRHPVVIGDILRHGRREPAAGLPWQRFWRGEFGVSG